MTGCFRNMPRCPGGADLPDQDRRTIYTIGHSNHTADAFVALLRKHDLGLVVDVRSSPYSRHVPQANRQALCSSLESADIKYRWMGDRLGGLLDHKTPDYEELCQRPSFQQGSLLCSTHQGLWRHLQVRGTVGVYLHQVLRQPGIKSIRRAEHDSGLHYDV